MIPSAALAVLLTFAIATLWVPARWAVGAAEVSVFALAAVVVWRKGVAMRWVVLAPALICLWASIQLIAHWTVVPAATMDSCLYWLSATCFAAIGATVAENGRDRFLNFVLIAGTIVSIAGTIQLFTSPGDVFWLFPSGFDRLVIGPFVSPNNYAAFVELLIPIALTRRGVWRLPVAAVLAATVVASGSRAGALLVAVEIIVILAIQRRPRDLALFGVLGGASVTVLGYQFLLARLAQGDPFAVRREFLESTVAMFRAQPLHGWGFGAWPWAYRSFALIDPGEFANHAHNEWAQWAAEGGIPALLVMLALFVWLVPRAFRSVWGLGIVAVMLHATVDYPFMRLGLAAWIFVLIGIAARQRGLTASVYDADVKNAGLDNSQAKPQSIGAATVKERYRTLPLLYSRGSNSLRLRLSLPLRFATCAVLFAGAFDAAKITYADVLYRRATAESVTQAARLVPRHEYQFALAQLDSARATQHLEAALADNPFHTESRIALAQEREMTGDTAGSERLLIEASRLDTEFAPAWALANFYFRTGDPGKFWQWVRQAGRMSFGDRRALFDLGLLETNDPAQVFARIGNPQMEEPFLRYLMNTRDPAAASEMALRVAKGGRPSDRVTLLDYVDVAIEREHPDDAWRVWTLLGEPANGRGFDWRITPTDGVYVTRNQNEWRIELSGGEPEECELLRRALTAGGVTLHYEYRTENLPSKTGLSWGAIPIESSDGWRSGSVSLAGEWASLAYKRPPGNMRGEGVLWMRNLRVEPESALLLSSH
jgi:O-antigen ligase